MASLSDFLNNSRVDALIKNKKAAEKVAEQRASGHSWKDIGKYYKIEGAILERLMMSEHQELYHQAEGLYYAQLKDMAEASIFKYLEDRKVEEVEIQYNAEMEEIGHKVKSKHIPASEKLLIKVAESLKMDVWDKKTALDLEKEKEKLERSRKRSPKQVTQEENVDKLLEQLMAQREQFIEEVEEVSEEDGEEIL